MAFNWLKKHFSKSDAPATNEPADNSVQAAETTTENTETATLQEENNAVVAAVDENNPPAEETAPLAAETAAAASEDTAAVEEKSETIAETASDDAVATEEPQPAETTETVEAPPAPETVETATEELPPAATPPAAEAAAEPVQPQTKPKNDSGGYFARIRQGLAKTRRGFADLFLGKKTLDQDLIDDLETQLLTADVGIEVTRSIIDSVTAQIDRKELKDVEAVKAAVRDHMQNLLAPYALPLDTSCAKPYVILMTGINGAGKTTTIGKLARHFQQEGKKVMLAAGDTFRAAAVEQLQTWGARHNVPVIAQGTGADAASVAYDALQSATARGIDVLIIDTAGRLHTQDHLMEELKKIKRVIAKLDPAAPHETMLIIDAGNGQNALRQAEQFHKAMQLDSITVTKLDGTAKGGILFAISEKLGIPIRYIGVGEQPEDLRPFNAQEFVQALLYIE